jgi:hypothetical protein
MRGFRDAKVGRRVLLLALALQLRLGLEMTASPWLHERLHHDANNAQHECVVTVMHAGGTDETTVALILAPDFLPAPGSLADAPILPAASRRSFSVLASSSTLPPLSPSLALTGG